jgi:choline transport protein
LITSQVSEFAPRRHQKILSYTSGWLSTLAWQAFGVVNAFVCAEIAQSMIVLNHPRYVPERWHQTLLTMAFAIGAGKPI